MSQKNIPYINFELSWLQFNSRVLDEGCRKSLPLLERLRFLSIAGTNLDEFMVIRVARLIRWDRENRDVLGPSGKMSSQVLAELMPRLRSQVERLYGTLETEVLPALNQAGLKLKRGEALKEDEVEYIRRYFRENLFSVLTPRFIGPGDLSLRETLTSGAVYVIFSFSEEELGLVKIPENLDRFVTLPGKKKVTLLPLEEVILRFGPLLWPSRQVRGAAVLRLSRDANLSVEEEKDEDFLSAMEDVLDDRVKGRPVRLEMVLNDSSEEGQRLRKLLPAWVDVDPQGVFELPRLPRLSCLMDMAQLGGFQGLQYPSWEPVPPAKYSSETDIWQFLKEQDLLIHHPYESFEPVVHFLEQAAEDPEVLAIKMTLYRTSGDSPLMRALETAARRGKQVTILVELKARFDEGRNIGWAKRLERAGAIVIHGMRNLKVHAKAAMVVRREQQGIRQYVHLGTGNYNDSTARKYTDLGLLSSRPELTLDTALFFNAITGHSTTLGLVKLVMAPLSLRGRFIQLIHREMDGARQGKPAWIRAKMNALNDPEIIRLLYQASEAGVSIDLNVRGACSLLPGLKGISSRIRVISIIDRYLEHSRLYSFCNGGKPEIYISSADWRTRNLDQRIELLVPLEGQECKARGLEILDNIFWDNMQSQELTSTGEWIPRWENREEPPFRAQEFFHKAAVRRHREREERNRRELQVRRKPPGT